MRSAKLEIDYVTVIIMIALFEQLLLINYLKSNEDIFLFVWENCTRKFYRIGL